MIIAHVVPRWRFEKSAWIAASYRSHWNFGVAHAFPNIEKQGESPMNWDRVEGNWKEFKGKVQQKWGKLTNDDLDVVKGKRGELAGRLQQRYGYAKDQAEREIDMWLRDAA
jgi:uncharacterized protein YjbJ (UPF0337 family)